MPVSTPHLSLVLIVPTHGGIARLSWPGWLVKPKFHIPLHRLCDKDWDKSATLSGTCPGLCRRPCRRLSPGIVMDQIPLQRHKQVCRGLVMDFVANISTCRDDLCPRLSWFVSATFTKTSWFHDLSPFVSATFMICAHDFPCREVLVKVGTIESGPYTPRQFTHLPTITHPSTNRANHH